jgi:hypothetical protein
MCPRNGLIRSVFGGLFHRRLLKFLQDAYMLAEFMLAEFVNLAPVERVRLAGPLIRWLREDRRQDNNAETTSTHAGRTLGENPGCVRPCEWIPSRIGSRVECIPH